jgi:putative thioredoxin
LLNQVDVSFENVRELLELSQRKLVVFAFWSERSEPSKQLLQTLSTICQEYPQHLVLAKVNCDLDQELAMQFGVRSLPTTMLIQNGQPVDGFAGAETEAQIRQRLQPYLPAAEELLLQQIQPLLDTQQWSEAYPLLKQAQQLAPQRVDITKLLALCAASMGQLEQAKMLLSTILLADQDSLYQQVVAVIELAEQAADSPEIRALEAKLAATPEDLLLKQQLAVQYQQVQRSNDALALLFSILQQDLAFGESKKLFLDILAVLPKGDALAGTYRRKLYSLLY